MFKSLSSMFKKSEDTRGTITPDQAMAYVDACSTKFFQYKAHDVKKYDDGDLVCWAVSAKCTDDVDTYEIDFHVWQVAEGEHGYGRNPELPTIYGEW